MLRSRLKLCGLLPLLLSVACAPKPEEGNDTFLTPVTNDAGIDAALGVDVAPPPVPPAPPAMDAAGPNLLPDTGVRPPMTLPEAAIGVDAAPLVDAGPVPDAGAAPDAGADSGAVDAGRADAASDAAVSDGGPIVGDAGPSGASQMRSVRVGSADRTFLLYVPSTLDKAKPAPLVSLHHGFTMTGKIMEEVTTWKRIADRDGFVVAFADGGTYLGPWNVGENVCGSGATVAGSLDQDDLGFVRAIIDSANMSQPINRERVFVAGFSMGGYFANHVGCQGRAFVRAVSAMSGGTYAGSCPGNPVPVLLIHGDADGLIDYMCATQARGYWVERNGCTTQVMSETIKGGSCEWNQGCPMGRELGLCTMTGMDHGWAGAPTSGPGAWLTAPISGNEGYGGGVQFEDGAELMWKFFKRYL